MQGLIKLKVFLSELGQSEWDKGIDGVGHGLRPRKSGCYCLQHWRWAPVIHIEQQGLVGTVSENIFNKLAIKLKVDAIAIHTSLTGCQGQS